MPSRRNPDPFAAQLGARIRQLRKERGMSLGKLAQASGLSRGHLSDIERGRTVMSIGTLGSIAGALDVPAFVICLVPKENDEIAVVDDAIAMAGGDTRKAAEHVRSLIEKIPPRDSHTDQPLRPELLPTPPTPPTPPT